jgi:hypothetical protein
MEQLVHCAKCQKPFNAVGEGTMREIAPRRSVRIALNQTKSCGPWMNQ